MAHEATHDVSLDSQTDGKATCHTMEIDSQKLLTQRTKSENFGQST